MELKLKGNTRVQILHQQTKRVCRFRDISSGAYKRREHKTNIDNQVQTMKKREKFFGGNLSI